METQCTTENTPNIHTLSSCPFRSFVTKDQSSSLAYVDSNNHAIIKVDNTTNVPYNEKRNTVRMTSKDSYGLGSVWIADMYHVPYGVSRAILSRVFFRAVYASNSALSGLHSGLRPLDGLRVGMCRLFTNACSKLTVI